MILKLVSALIIIICITSNTFCQISDNFSDGDFTQNPSWTGNTSAFIVDAEALRLNESGAGESHLVTASTAIGNTTWAFDVTLNFNPSGSNRAFVYLVSDQEDLQGSLHGYYVLIGNSSDEISLYRQDGASATKIIDGINKSVNLSPVNVRVRVTRDDYGNWELFQNVDGDGEVSEGTVIDNTYTSADYFGFLADYTSTRADKFFFDNVLITTPLEIDTIFASSHNEIKVMYNQPVDEATATDIDHYHFNDLTIHSITRSTTNTAEVTITTNEVLADTSYTVTITDVADPLTGTPIADSLSGNFTYLHMAIENVETVAANVVTMDFNQPVDQTSAEISANYTVDHSVGNPVAAVVDGDNLARVTLTLANDLKEGSDYQLTVSDVNNVAGNSSFSGTSGTFQFVIPLLIDSVLAVSSSTSHVIFNKEIDPSSATVVGNYLLNGSDTPQSAALVNDTTVALAFDAGFPDAQSIITVNHVADETLTATADNLSDSFDYLSLEITDATSDGMNRVTITFNQAIDPVTARAISNYEVNFDIGNPSTALYDNAVPDQVVLKFDSLVNNQYTLTLGDLLNRPENSTALNQTVDFTVSRPTEAQAIVISEVFADPSPSVGLPSSEFLELYNRSTFYINLGDFTVSGGTLPDMTIAPGGYLILTSATNMSDYDSFGKVAGVTSFATLTNSGRDLVLKDQFGHQIDSVSYDETWYRDDKKSDGGYSLELINPELPCSGAFNWIASNETSGGTPGAENSVFDDSPDTTSPEINDITVIEGDSLVITFNEPVDVDMPDAGDFGLSGQTISVVAAVADSDHQIAVKLSTTLASEAFYTFNSDKVPDCSGNAGSGSFEVYYDITPPNLNSIVINSLAQVTVIFSEPVEASAAETEANFSIVNGLGNPSGAERNGEFLDRVLLTFDEELDTTITYALRMENIADTSSNVLSAASVSFKYQQDIDSVAVIAPNLMDVYFNQAVDEASGSEVTNYDLETLGQPVSAAVDQQNRALVHLAFAEGIRENNERALTVSGVLNSSASLLSTPEFLFTYDTRAPSLDAVAVLNATQVLITFSEEVVQNSAELVNHYEVADDIIPDSVRLQLDRTQVIAYFENEFEEEVRQTITVRNVEDLFGNSSGSATNRRLTFSYDPLPPRLDTLIQLSRDSLLLVFSEELESISGVDLANYELSSSVNSSSAEFIHGDSARVTLKFSTEIPETDDQMLTISKIADKAGNVLTTPIEQTFNALNPQLSTVLFTDPDTLVLSFSKEMDAATLLDVANYQLSGTPDFSTITQIDGQNVSLNFTDGFTDQQKGTLALSNGLLGTNGNTLKETMIELKFEDQLDTVLVVNNNTLALQFEPEMAMPRASAFELSGSTASPVIVSNDPDDANVIRLVFSEPLTENTVLTLAWKGLTDVFDHPVPDGSVDFNYDTESPTISSIEPQFFNEVDVTFSEKLDQTSALAFNHYEVTSPNGINIEDVQITADSIVHLFFDQNLVEGTTYTLSINRVEDLFGNVLRDVAIDFVVPVKEVPAANELLITELMADPSPVVGLPQAEYIEIYNNAGKTFDLATVALSDATGVVSLPDVVLVPGEYLVLTSSHAVNLFESGLSVVGVTNFPSLGNNGDSLSLVSRNDVLIDRVVYSKWWYDDTEKDDGGFSLERISLLEVCDIAANWMATNASGGGTPGEQNSVFDNTPDSTAPEIVSTEIDGSVLTITFNEPMDPSTFVEAGLTFVETGFTFDPSVTISDIYYSDDRLSVQINADFPPGNIFTTTLTNMTDCTGNALTDNQFTFGVGATPGTGDLIITEIMADPEPTQGQPNAEYIEVYNASNRLVEIEELMLHDATGSTTLPTATIASGDYLILTSSNAVNLFESGLSVVGVTNFPSLGNNGDSLSLVSRNDVLIDRVVYSKWWYDDTEKDDGGFSLERISLLEVCDIAANWMATNASGGGTPGEQNSVFDNTSDTIAPEIVSTDIDGSVLTITFNEPMDPSTFVEAGLTFDPSVTISDISYSNDRLSVQITADFTPGNIFITTLTNNTDCTGNALMDNQFTFGVGATPGAGDLIITELMADPEPTQGQPNTEYIEIYNASDLLVEIEELMLHDATGSTTLPTATIASGDYLILTSSNAVDLFASDLSVVGVTNFPSLGNNGDSLSLFSRNDVLIDRVVYSKEWYDDTEKDDGGFSLERISLLEVCDIAANWMATNASDGGTPGEQNSVFDNTVDTTAPEIVSTDIDGSVLTITFNELMDPSTFVEAGLTFEPSVRISDISYPDDRLSVQITADFTPGNIFTTTLNITDCTGNTLMDNQFTFGVGITPGAGDLIITELMADPEPAQGQPNAEYIEIYNTSDLLVAIEGLTLYDATGSTTLPSATIASGDYLVLTSSHAVDLFELGLSVVGMTNFPSLGNNGDSLSLVSRNDVLIDRVVYSKEWYDDTEKDDGGFSLERISLLEVCNIVANWTATNANSGGTPGEQNSVFDNTPDPTAPEIVLTEINASVLTITFNEPMDPSTFVAVGFTFYPVAAISEVRSSPDRRQVFITGDFSGGIVYQLITSGLTDCSGNPLTADPISFGQGRDPRFGELLITEIMSDPEPSQGLPVSEYLEVYNASDDLLHLGNVILSDGSGETSLPDISMVPGTYLTLTPTSTVDLFAEEASAAGVAGWLSLSNGGERLQLSASEEIFRVQYSEEWYDDPLFEGGRSLEMVDVTNFCGEDSNWTVSTANEGGTPGRQNAATATNPDTEGPVLLEAFAVDAQTVKLLFNERVLVQHHNTFTTTPALILENAVFTNEMHSELEVTSLDTIAARTTYEVSATGVTDCLGNLSQVNTVAFVLTEEGESGDLLLNEILFDPRSGGADFVELYNNSEKFINLKNWAFGNDDYFDLGNAVPITAQDLIIGPGEYLAFTDDKTVTLNDYPDAPVTSIVAIDNLPAFPDSEGAIVLVLPDGSELERFEYSDDLHSALLDRDEGVSLERISFNSEANDENNWKSAASSAGFATPGAPNSQALLGDAPNAAVAVSPRVFVPDGSGGVNSQSFTTIHYELDNSGSFANVSIYDAKGQFVREIANGELLSRQGFFRWDGLDEHEKMVTVGYYIVIFELFDANGHTSLVKQTVVVGTQL